jgi:hypothetical protein
MITSSRRIGRLKVTNAVPHQPIDIKPIVMRPHRTKVYTLTALEYPVDFGDRNGIRLRYLVRKKSRAASIPAKIYDNTAWNTCTP